MFSRNKTFKPKRKHRNQKQRGLHKIAKNTLGSGDLRQAVILPRGENLNEWLAVNTVDFFNMTNLLYGSVTEFCTRQSCPKMTAGPEYDPAIRRPVSLSAPDYVDHLMTWIEKKVNNPQIFPSDSSTQFPRNFKEEIKAIFKRLFRVYAHVYYTHFDRIERLGEEAHLNTAFKHFMYFVFEFRLIRTRELEPMKEVIISLLGDRYEEKFSSRRRRRHRGDQ